MSTHLMRAAACQYTIQHGGLLVSCNGLRLCLHVWHYNIFPNLLWLLVWHWTYCLLTELNELNNTLDSRYSAHSSTCQQHHPPARPKECLQVPARMSPPVGPPEWNPNPTTKLLLNTWGIKGQCEWLIVWGQCDRVWGAVWWWCDRVWVVLWWCEGDVTVWGVVWWCEGEVTGCSMVWWDRCGGKVTHAAVLWVRLELSLRNMNHPLNCPIACCWDRRYPWNQTLRGQGARVSDECVWAEWRNRSSSLKA